MPSDFTRGDLGLSRPGAGIARTQSHPGAPGSAEVETYPGRLYNWQAAPLNPRLRAALASNPDAMVGCVSMYVSGRRVRWSTRSIAIPSSEVHGGALWFEGRLLGDGEYVSSVNLDERGFDVPSFSIEADNELNLGIEGGTEQQGDGFVNPLTGAYVEIAIAHPGVDWSGRYVVIRGTLSGVSYGPQGSTLKFSVVPFWRSLDARIVPPITRERFPLADDENYGKTMPIVLGTPGFSGHVVLRVLELGGATDIYMVSVGNPGNIIAVLRDKDGFLKSITAQVQRKDSEGRWYEAINVIGAGVDDAELFATVDETENGFLDMKGPASHRARSIGRAIMYLIARFAQIDGSDVDFAGLSSHSFTRQSAYGISIDSESSMRSVLVDRLAPQTDGMFTIRRSRLAFVALPNFDIYPEIQPVVKAHLRFGVDLLSFTDITEPSTEGLISSISAVWDYRANEVSTSSTDDGPGYFSGVLFAKEPTTPEIDSASSFWFRTGESLHGKSQSIAIEAPDLLLWRDVRNAIRFEEIVRSRVLREIDYTATAVRTLGLYPGDFVRITHDEQNFDEKLFLVSNVGVRLRPIVRLGLIEWPLAQDHFGAFGGVNLTEV